MSVLRAALKRKRNTLEPKHGSLARAVRLLVVSLALLMPAVGQGAVDGGYSVLLSTAPDRTNPVALEGATMSGSIYVFTGPDTNVKRVEFFLDDPTMSGAPFHTEGGKPYDFNGTAKDGKAVPFDTGTLANGSHAITAKIVLTNGTTHVPSGTFTVDNQGLVLSAETSSFAVDAGESVTSQTVDLTTSDGASVSYTASEDASWLDVSPASETTPQTLTLTANPAGLAVGTHKTTVTVSASGYDPDTLAVELTVKGKLLVSTSSSRSFPLPLEGEEVWSNTYVFVGEHSGIADVSFYVDDPGMTGTPLGTETKAPWDLMGGSDSNANPFDTTTLIDGPHTITAKIKASSGGTHAVTATFDVINGAPGMTMSPAGVMFPLDPGQSQTQTVQLTASDGSAGAFDVAEDVPWLTVTPVGGATPTTLTLSADTAGLDVGTYTGIVKVTAAGYRSGTLPVELRIGCPPLACADALVNLPYELEFTQDEGKILDGSGVGTGFTWLDQPSKSIGYIPENLAVDTATGVLQLTTTKGLQYTASNALDNALGVGIDAPSQISVVTAKLVNPPAGTGNYEQAGVWFGNDEDNYDKLVVNSTPGGVLIEHLMEANGKQKAKKESAVLDLTGATVSLSLFVNPLDQTIAAFYRINGGLSHALGVYNPPPEFFSFDAARIDPRIHTDSFGGIFASHRNGPAPLTYAFDYFGVVEGTSSAPPSSEGIAFDRTSFPVPFPTSLAWGPDNRLYVTEIFGDIHAITLGPDKQVLDNQVIGTIGTRLTLGITVDPASTPENVILWVAHSSPSLDNGEINSSTVTRLSGPGFTTREDVITGLPRAKANHGINSIHFGPDGRLYIAMGGNTGAGGRDSNVNSEFGDRAEQPLSAALLVADVKTAGFDGSCANTADPYGPPPCDVMTFATGLRNTYDFVFHSNGSIYGPNNGLGVGAVMPPSPTAPCTEFGTVDPGQQPDPLNRLVEGKYYGHPNPSRGECVFFDGSNQGVSPLPNYELPVFNLGDHRSANGTIEYTSDKLCGDLKGELLIANYSVGDDITRVRLSEDGLSALSAGSLVGGFNDPLPLLQGPDGTIYVGEAGASVVTALTPADLGCWTSRPDLPAAILDVGGTAVGGKLYLVGGKTNGGHQSTMYVYDPASDTWSAGPDLPGPAVENPAAVELDGKLYVFGGSTDPFSDAVANAAVFDPAAGTWTPLTPMSTPRGGAVAQAIGGKIYVAGGMGADGASLAGVEVYDPAADSWSAAAPMSTRRDNPGAAALDGKLYVFGGRTRDADGTTPADILNSGEVYDPATDSWSATAPMPTARRTMMVGTLNGRAQVMGGERAPDGSAFPQNEEYDPVTDTWRSLKGMQTARHGGAAGTIDGVVYVAGGGPLGGLSFSNLTEAFAFEN